ncbi:hypothetical protein DRE_04192 [Drechslerella stenobrocha 248]|uniref:Nephrocystin 3-like N-terminal domain-containing protein n=1 Tax=Drechslerella stenobrocha 248 TaxID=1043628 RepID=W7HT44_9PEZI|nr:hypothetical protein DRE_04192 [Drechslerella stenobrocha 248]
MDGLSVAASVAGLVQISVEIAKVCGRYLKEAKNARKDVKDIQDQATTTNTLLGHTKELLEGPNGARLSASRELGSALSDCKVELEALQKKLEEDFPPQVPGPEKRLNRLFSRISIRDLKWPFTKNEVVEIVANLERMQQSISRALQVDQVRILLTVEEEANLAKLPIADGAIYGSFDDENEPECLPDTRTDLLEDIKKWIMSSNPDEKSMFWLCGMAGTGKSTISRSVARILQDNHQLGASFFFKRGKGYRGDASRFVTTIVGSLRLFAPQLGPELSKVIADDPSIATKTMKEQFERLMFKPLSKIDLATLATSNPRPTLGIVIDALDECEGEDAVQSIINLLAKLQDLQIDLRIFITSRPETPIKLGFRELEDRQYKDLILHDIQKATIQHDICVFLQHEFSRIQRHRKLGSDWPGDKTISALTEISVPLFISAATISRFVADRRFSAQDRLDAILKFRHTTASKLDKTYLPVFDQVLIGTDGEEQEMIISSFQDTVSTIVLLESPLSRLSLSTLLNKPETHIQCELDPYHSVLNIPDDPKQLIQTFHLSFRDFVLSDHNRNRKRAQIQKLDYNVDRIAFSPSGQFLETDMGDINLQSPGELLNVDPKVKIAVRGPWDCGRWPSLETFWLSKTEMREDAMWSSFAFLPKSTICGG